MRYFATRAASVAAALGLVLLTPSLDTAAHANWLTALTKGAGKAAHHADVPGGPIGRAASHLADLPAGTRGLAAHATPEGHWQFVNKEGQVFTAGNADEMGRVLPALLPDAAAEGKLSLYLSEESVFANRAHIDKLPQGAELRLVAGNSSYPLVRKADGGLSLQHKPNVALDLAARADFDEALAYLARPLNKSDIRTLALEPGSARTLSSAPRFDATTKAPLVDAVDPGNLAHALHAIRGQTALVVGRIDGTKLIVQPAKGGEVTLDLPQVLSAARNSDVNLVLLHADAPRQPGGRNWLWQTMEVGGLQDAMGKATFGDFLDALGAKRGSMTVAASHEAAGRIRLTAMPDDTGSAVSAAQETVSELLGHVTGEIATKAVEVHARDDGAQSELDGRIIPGIPTYIQIPYLVQVFFGLLAWGVSRSWWSKIWPPRRRAEGEGRLANMARNIPNFAVYLLAFLPVAGGAAFIWHALVQVWSAVTAPFRWIGRLLRRRVEV